MNRAISMRVSDRRSVSLPHGSTSAIVNSNPTVVTLPVAEISTVVSPPKVVDKWEFRQILSDPVSQPVQTSERTHIPFLYLKMQYIIQEMLHSDKGVPIRSRSKLLSALPSVFTGSDIIQWTMKRYSCLKTEAIHVCNVLYNHGYFYSVEKLEQTVRDDGALFRFQTPHLWPSQNFNDSDFEYAVYLVKQVWRNKTRFLEDYELENLKNLKRKLILQWDYVSDRASDEARILKEQKKVARNLMENQERAFWRLRRPPPGVKRITDCLLSKFCMSRKDSVLNNMIPLDVIIKREIDVLKDMLETKRLKLSTSLDGLITHCKKYAEFDPMLNSPVPANPWISNDETLWIIERSLVEFPTERQLKLWACSLEDLLHSVTGRYKFEQFCRKQYCVENIKFWQACCDIKLLPLVSVPGSVKIVYDEFIDPNAPHMVNLNVTAFEEAKKDLENPTRYAFSAAQEQVYVLMRNDIYPRFLKTDYDVMLKTAHSNGSLGKSFFKRLIPRNAQKTSTERAIPIEIISPCHPQRYTKRQLSISRSSNSSQLDSLFLSARNWDSNTEYDTSLVNALTSPSTELNLIQTAATKENEKLRRISAPTVQLPETVLNSIEGSTSSGLAMLNELSEDEKNVEEKEGKDQKMLERNKIIDGIIRTSLVQSQSMDDFNQYKSDDETANGRSIFHTQLMSLRSPQGEMFDPAEVILDRKKSISIENLSGFIAPISPLASMTNFSPPDYSNSDTTKLRAPPTVNTNTIQVPSNEYLLYSSNDSIHSAISS